jgi:hypothetical protein
MRLAPFAVALGLACLGPRGALAAGDPPPSRSEARWLSARIDVAGWLASLEGSLQTPAGGDVGTTSPGRPRLDEIGLGGLRVLPSFDAGLVALGKHELRLHYDHVDIGGDAFLETPLVSQGQLFPAGSPVESRLRLSFLRVGYRALWLPPLSGEWRLTPEAGIAFVPLRYQLRSPVATGAVDRAYGVGTLYYGLELAGPVYRNVDLELELLGAGGLNHVSYIDNEVRIVWRALETPHTTTSFLLGLRGAWFRRADQQQPVENAPDVRVGSFSTDPWSGLTFGVRLEF